MSATAERLPERYWKRVERQLPLLGRKNQERIAATRLTIIGCSGNGSPTALVAALTGFRHLTLVDGDRLSLSNLNRFTLGGLQDVGDYKVDTAKRTLEARFPELRIRAIAKDVRAPGVLPKASACDWMIDATDNDTTRRFLHQHCRNAQIPLISLGSGFLGHCGAITAAGCRVNRVRRGDACLECQVLDEAPMPQARASLVIPNIIAAALAVDLLVREITAYDVAGTLVPTSIEGPGADDIHGRACIPEPDGRNAIYFDLLARRIHTTRVVPRPDCPICGTGSPQPLATRPEDECQ